MYVRQGRNEETRRTICIPACRGHIIADLSWRNTKIDRPRNQQQQSCSVRTTLHAILHCLLDTIHQDYCITMLTRLHAGMGHARGETSWYLPLTLISMKCHRWIHHEMNSSLSTEFGRTRSSNGVVLAIILKFVS
jgi:hypothetical protein